MTNTATKPLNREAFLKRSVTREVPLADGAVVCIRALPASLIVEGAENSGAVFDSANMLVQSLCDENGQLLFAEEEKKEAMTIDHLSLQTILDAVLDLNGLRPAGDGEVGVPGKN